jgi:DNA-binding CsgD family transcriptional regulator
MTPSPSRLIGRDRELERLATTVDAAADARPAFVLVVGEAGIGKSVLLAATARHADARGLRVLTGTAVETGGTIPYLPLIGPLSAAVDETMRDAASTTVRRVVGGEVSDQSVESAADADRAAAARFIEAVFDVLVRRPTLLVVDDVHWADRSTVTVLDYLSRRASDVPLAIIAAARDDELGRLLELPIADGRRFEQVALRRLTRSEVADQATGLLGARPTAVVVDRLFERSAGNPMFVEELLNADGTGSGQGVAATSSAALRGLVLGRVGRLPAEATTAIEALAVIGRPADDELVGAVAGQTPEVAGRALAAAVRGGVAINVGGSHDMRHPIVAEVVAASIAGSAARRLHRRAAEALESVLSPGSAGERANHWLAAGDARRAWAASLDAADEASRAYAFSEAAGALHQAVDLWPPDEPGVVAGLLRAAEASWMSGDAETALALARQAESRIEIDTAPQALELTIAIGRYAWDAGERQTATSAFVRAIELVRDDTTAGLRSRALWGFGRGKIGEGDFQAAFDNALASAAAAHEAGEPAWEGEGWVLAGMARAWAGADGTAELWRGLDCALEAGDPGCAGHAYQFLVDQLALHGRRAEALTLAEDGAASADRLGTATTHGSDVRGYAGFLLIDEGRWPEAEAILEPAEPRAIPSLARALVAIRRGDFHAADKALSATLDGLSIGGRGLRGGVIELARTELAWLRGDLEEARRAFAEIVPAAGVWRQDMLAWQALWERRLALPPSEGPRPTHMDARLDRALEAEITAETNAGGLDATAWAAAADAWSVLGWPYHEGWARLRQAEAGFAAGDREAARTALHETARIGDELGCAPMSERAVDLARRARVAARATRRVSPDPSELTPREHDVLVLLAEGRTNRQVAEALFLSPKTVELHVSRILDKLDAGTRGEAVAKARRSGLLMET